MKTITIQPFAGDTIQFTCDKAVKLARGMKCRVRFVFNEVPITAYPDSDLKSLAKAYMDACDRRHAEYIASPEYKRSCEEAAQKQRIREETLKAMLADSPPHMTLRDEDGWKKAVASNTDPYGGACITYSERWARLMEGRMAKGESLEAVAEECSSVADEEGITGFMYGCAVSMLSHVWIHGEALRVWHNLKTQIGNEGEKANKKGGVLNPALLRIG